ncbi:TPA: hypothetical protein SMR42_000832 [Pseudomonas putida]|nr:hypothetical protein [Pseudomonas putida]
MNAWNWDPCNNFLGKLILLDIPPELKTNGVRELSISRNDELQLTLETISPASLQEKEEKHPLGTIHTNDKTILLDFHGGQAILKGVHRTKSSTRFADPLGTTKNTYNFHSVEYKHSPAERPDFTVDHIANLPQHYFWPHSSRAIEENTHTLKFSQIPSLNIRLRNKTDNLQRKCLHLNLGGQEVVIGIQGESSGLIKNPGYILYIGDPSDQIRERIRNALSFTFGAPLIYFGSSAHTQQGNITSTNSCTPHTVSGNAWRITPLPPAPITEEGEVSNILSPEYIQHVATGFFSNDHNYNLSRLPWRLWYAESAPYFMRPAYYGALIEGIQTAYIESNPSTISNTITTKPEFNRSRKILSRYLSSLDLDELQLKLFTDKLNGANKAPQRIISERFFKNLNLELGQLEITAWNKRNDAAHGNEIPQGAEINFIRETKILKIVLNRIILQLTEGSDFYIDYFTLGHPIRRIESCIGETDAPTDPNQKCK